MTSTMDALDIETDVETLRRDGIVGKKGAFSREWAEAMREDMMRGFWSAIQGESPCRNSAEQARRDMALLAGLARHYVDHH